MALSRRPYHFFTYLLLAFAFSLPATALGNGLPQGFVYVDDTIPGISLEIRYFSDHNFVGQRIDGYTAPRCILTREAAEALKGVQEDLSRFGLGLKIFDAYRPQRAVDHFVRWGEDLGAVQMKKEFYPNVEKQDLFKDRYIDQKSGHSRGSTVDLTIIALDGQTPGAELDMGSSFDYFGPQSWPDSLDMGPDQRAHRMLLQNVMKNHGFKPYTKEWWHFTLVNEPFPDTYFDFPIK